MFQGGQRELESNLDAVEEVTRSLGVVYSARFGLRNGDPDRSQPDYESIVELEKLATDTAAR